MKLRVIDHANITAAPVPFRTSTLFKASDDSAGFGYAVRREPHKGPTLLFPNSFDGLCLAVQAMCDWQDGKGA